MNRLEWLLVVLPLVSTWTLDRSTKIWGSRLTELVDFGFIQFSLHYNPGAMLGLFSNLPAVLRVVSLSTAGAFLVCIYLLIQYLLPIKSLILRSGMSILLGGIIGNVTDRILYGHVIDFILFNFGNFLSPVFNVADVLQWVGYVMIVYAVITEGEILWPENNARKRYWINPSFQLKYCFLLLGIGFGIALITSVFSFTYLRVTMIDLIGQNSTVLDRFLIPFLETSVVMTVGISLALFSVGKIISHRIAGPLYAFEKYLTVLIENPNKPIHKFRLRSHDEFKHLELLAEQIRKTVQEERTDSALILAETNATPKTDQA
jgi:signal peptidase II